MSAAALPRMIVLQFSTEGNDVGSLAIRWWQRWTSPYTHVDAVMPEGGLLGARLDGGVRIRPEDYAPFRQVIRVEIPCLPNQADKFYRFMRGQRGKPYDWTAILAMAFPRMVTWFSGRKWCEEDSWFCSELVVAALLQAKVVAHLPTEATKITPAHANMIAQAHTGARVIVLKPHSGEV